MLAVASVSPFRSRKLLARSLRSIPKGGSSAAIVQLVQKLNNRGKNDCRLGQAATSHGFRGPVRHQVDWNAAGLNPFFLAAARIFSPSVACTSEGRLPLLMICPSADA